MRIPLAPLPFALLPFVLACGTAPAPDLPPDGRPEIADLGDPSRSAGTPAPLEFQILEDFEDLSDAARIRRDLRRIRALGARVWRGSFGWDDLEPRPGDYRLDDVVALARLAAEEGVGLRPYVAYTPEWAGEGTDGQPWNDPPSDLARWSRFVDTLQAALEPTGAVISWEIYNEQNVPLWWEGTPDAYARTYAAAVEALGAPATVFPGGLVWPDAAFVEEVCGSAPVDVIAVHAYPETWTPDSVRVENYLGEPFEDEFLPVVLEACGDVPIWINEMGFATTAGATERDQAAWFLRAVATFAGHLSVQSLGLYELQDLPLGADVIGDPENHHLGLFRADGTPKPAWSTVRFLIARLESPALERRSFGGWEGGWFRTSDGRETVIVWRPEDPGTFTPPGGASWERHDLEGVEVSALEPGRPIPLEAGELLVLTREG